MLRIINSIISFAVLISIVTCASSQEKETSTPAGKFKEGIIVYKIKYPDLDTSNVMAKALPDSMVLYVKNGMCRWEIKRGNIYRNIRIRRGDEVVVLTTVVNKHVGTVIDSNIYKNEILPNYPLIKHAYKKEPGTRSPAGFKSSFYKAFGVEDEAIALFVTNEVEVDRPNLFTQYHNIPELLLEYYKWNNGKRALLSAVRMERKKLSDELFKADPEYKMISWSQYEEELRPPSGLNHPPGN